VLLLLLLLLVAVRLVLPPHPLQSGLPQPPPTSISKNVAKGRSGFFVSAAPGVVDELMVVVALATTEEDGGVRIRRVSTTPPWFSFLLVR